ncbi:P63C domain-containing protein [Chitinophaga rhizophila]|uniref:P63C domain-containing protein n=1 Tax=Chitinophaga rhizophila TaxID=2866212 RepID=A0ABS7G701_9BACT|nr:P63C domain-containing protein [Chitinophaga rhizophila]MBW8683425.1 P63C domain-containing protein [Chitinophaga rhizophila]
MKEHETDSSKQPELNQDKQPLPRKAADMTKEELEQQRALLTRMLIQAPADKAKADELKREKDLREIELIGGKIISLQQIKDMVTAARQPYEPKFGRGIDFFPEMYRLKGWTDKDPYAFIKPYEVGDEFNQVIYSRFKPDVRPALQALAVPGGVRIDKFFQYLTPEGVVLLELYRDEAIALMKQCTTWYEFRVRYGRAYGVTVPMKMFETYKGV